jgi:hypothetical protein
MGASRTCRPFPAKRCAALRAGDCHAELEKDCSEPHDRGGRIADRLSRHVCQFIPRAVHRWDFRSRAPCKEGNGVPGPARRVEPRVHRRCPRGHSRRARIAGHLYGLAQHRVGTCAEAVGFAAEALGARRSVVRLKNAPEAPESAWGDVVGPQASVDGSLQGVFPARGVGVSPRNHPLGSASLVAAKIWLVPAVSVK